ncbi:MAG TPA: hypothetical protein VGQ60_00660 [Nitrospiraceae bacterium]|jgi:hypothetical protein|nr:hypothetical protein [Nitrospiraceae bacterium]
MSVDKERAANGAAAIERVLTSALRVSGPTTMDRLVSLLPCVSWSQVFLAVDRLSRSGTVSLQRTRSGDYRIALNGVAA